VWGVAYRSARAEGRDPCNSAYQYTCHCPPLTGGFIMALTGQRVAVLVEQQYQELEVW
jgi:hypothetical protein